MSGGQSAESDALMALDLEYRLTVADRVATGCDECPAYFTRRREVLIPAVLKQAADQGKDPVDLFAEFARKVHARHGGERPSGFTVGRFVALMAALSETPDEQRTSPGQADPQ